MALTEAQAATVAERRRLMLDMVRERINGDSFMLFTALGGQFGLRVKQRQFGLLKIAIFGDGRPGTITERYTEAVEDEDGNREIVVRTVTTDNEKMLLDRAFAGWWDAIEPELYVDPLVHIDRCGDDYENTRFDEHLYATDKTTTPWTLARVDGMPGYGGIAELSDKMVGKALGLVGGALPYETHPVVAFPAVATVAPGETATVQLGANAGKSPYRYEKVGTDPAWADVVADGVVTLAPAATVPAGKFDVTFRVTDSIAGTSDNVLSVLVATQS